MALGQVDDSQKSQENQVANDPIAPDGQTDSSLDQLTRLIADIFETPIVAISLEAGDHLQVKSSIGLDAHEDVEITKISANTINQNAPFILQDNNDLDDLSPSLKELTTTRLGFFACVPIVTTTQQVIGALCIADTQSKPAFSKSDTVKLQVFSTLVAEQIQHRQAEESQKTSSALLASMSHDIRTPLNGILGMAELILATDDLEERQRRRVKIIKQSGAKLHSMLNSLLAFARIDAKSSTLDAASVDLRQLLNNVVHQLQQSAQDEVLQFNLIDQLEHHHSVLGDPALIRELISHFMDVASKCAAEGAMDVTALAQPVDAGKVLVHLKAQAFSTNEDIVRHLTGSSFDEASFSFEKDNEVSLGLAICHKLSKIMRGEIVFDQNTDKSLIFQLKILLSLDSKKQQDEQTPDSFSTSAQNTEIGTNSKSIRNILVAEDDPDMACLIGELLDEAGYHATIAPDGASVIRIVDNKHIDVVLMDGHLPDMSGFEALEHIRRLPDGRANLPIIALTGDALPGDRERYLSAGMDEHLIKPVDYDTLIHAIDCCYNIRR